MLLLRAGCAEPALLVSSLLETALLFLAGLLLRTALAEVGEAHVVGAIDLDGFA